ncbi:MAG: hypothetical protein SGJ17_15375 [Hyphomicrobiales bacterium]|nr:hypothetical protein [Hyphomicrobiales bacterium]
MTQKPSTPRVPGKEATVSQLIPGERLDNAAARQNLNLGKSALVQPAKNSQPLKPQSNAVGQTETIMAPGAKGTQISPAKRAAAVSRAQLAANDDAPSIGGLIFALQQRPSRSPFLIALITSAMWLIAGLLIGRGVAAKFLPEGASFGDILSEPSALALMAATVMLPIALFWFLAVLVWRSQELRLMSSAMTEVAVRLAEPDKMAEQSVASLGQTVRRQVAAMNEAISRALGRAGELEALVHNEVAALERSYTDNEHRIRNLINELASEREALANNSERVSEALRGVGSQVTREISAASEKASQSLTQASASMADTLASRGHKITSAVTAAGTAIDEKLAERGTRITEQLVKHGAQTAEVLRQSTLEVTKAIQETSDRTTAAISAKNNSLVTSVISMSERVGREIPALLDRLGGEQSRLSGIIENATKNLSALEGALTEKTENIGVTLADKTKMLQTVLSDHSRTIDTSMVERIQVLETMLSGRTRTFEATITERTKTLETSIVSRTQTLENAVARHSSGIRETLEKHSQGLDQNLTRQTQQIERTVAGSAQSLHRAVEELARRSGASSDQMTQQAQVLKDVSGGLLNQIHALTKRFEDQGSSIMNAARSLDVANTKVDTMMEARQGALTKLLDSINGRAIELDRMMNSYSHMLEQSLSQAEVRAKKVTEVLAKDSAEKSQAAIKEIERLRSEAQIHTNKAVTDLQSGFSTLSDSVSQQMSSLSTKFGETTREVRASATKAAAEIEMTQTELRRQATTLPEVTKQSATAMRKVLNDQLSAIGNMAEIAGRHGYASQVSRSDPRAGEHYQNAQGGRPGAPRNREEYNSYGGFDDTNYVMPGDVAQNSPTPWSGSPEDLSSLTSGLSQRLDAGKQPSWSNALPDDMQQVDMRQPSYAPGADAGERRGQWSLGDLLARASEPDDDDYGAQGGSYGRPVHQPPAPPFQSPAPPFQPPAPPRQMQPPRFSAPPEPPRPRAPVDLGMEEMASAIEPGKVLDIWQRYNRGDRGAIHSGIYNPNGQQTFDKVRRRYETDVDFRQIADRYVDDFENLLKDAARTDPKGRMIQDNLTSDTGRIYLLLAHASGRLG